MSPVVKLEEWFAISYEGDRFDDVSVKVEAADETRLEN